MYQIIDDWSDILYYICLKEIMKYTTYHSHLVMFHNDERLISTTEVYVLTSVKL